MSTNTIQCECGRSKTAGRQACDLCTFLDGRGASTGEIIWAMRCGAQSVYEVAEMTGLRADSVLRALRALARRGRVRQFGGQGRVNYFSLTGGI